MSSFQVFLFSIPSIALKNFQPFFLSEMPSFSLLINFIDTFIRTFAMVTFFMALYALFSQYIKAIFFFKAKISLQGKNESISLESRSDKHVLKLLKHIRALPSQENNDSLKNLPKSKLLGQSLEFYPQLREWFLKSHPYLNLTDPQLVNDAFNLELFESKIEKCKNAAIRDHPIIQKYVKLNAQVELKKFLLINRSITFAEAIERLVLELCQRDRWSEIELLQSFMPTSECLVYLHYRIELWRHHDEGGLHSDLMNTPLILAPLSLLYILSCPRYSMEFKQLIIMQLSSLPLLIQKKEIFSHEKYLQLLILLASASSFLRCCIVRWLELYLYQIIQHIENATEKRYFANQLNGKGHLNQCIHHFCGLKTRSYNKPCQEKEQVI